LNQWKREKSGGVNENGTWSGIIIPAFLPLLFFHSTFADIAQGDMVIFSSYSHGPAINQGIDIAAKMDFCSAFFAHILRDRSARDSKPLRCITLAHTLIVYQAVNHLGPYTREVFTGE
jgi:hypothetical protein